MKETEQARTRRRWITLGEVVGIAALAISGLSYWDSHQERVVAAKAKPAAARAGPLLLTGTLADGGARIDLKPATGGVIQTQTIRFPTAVRADPVETTGNARIEAAWFDTGLRAALKGRKVHSGRHRLAVGIATTYVSNGVSTTDRAVYDIGYALHTRVLRPDAVVIEGVSFVHRISGDLSAPVDARFVQSPEPAE